MTNNNNNNFSQKVAAITCSGGHGALDSMLPLLLNTTGGGGFDVIAIDEGHFFPEIAKVATKLANAGKIVIVAALNSDFLQQVCFANRHHCVL